MMDMTSFAYFSCAQTCMQMAFNPRDAQTDALPEEEMQPNPCRA